MFLANTFAVSALAKTCKHMGEMSSASEMSMEQTSANDELPCHEHMKADKSEQKPPAKHCDGLCLCVHASVNQIIILEEIASFSDIDLSKSQAIITSTASVNSLATAPPRRPPKMNS